MMPRIPFSLPEHVTFRNEFQPGRSVEEGAPSGRSHEGSPPSIVPGGAHFFSTSTTSAFRPAPLSSKLHAIEVSGVAGRFWIKAAGATDVHELYTRDPQTDAPVPTGRYARMNDQGHWVAADAFAPSAGQAIDGSATGNVRGPDSGNNRAATPDGLAEYRSNVSLPADARRNGQGVYGIDGRRYITIKGDSTHGKALYEIRQNTNHYELVKPGQVTSWHAPWVKQNEDGSFSAVRVGLNGGMDDGSEPFKPWNWGAPEDLRVQQRPDSAGPSQPGGSASHSSESSAVGSAFGEVEKKALLEKYSRHMSRNQLNLFRVLTENPGAVVSRQLAKQLTNSTDISPYAPTKIITKLRAVINAVHETIGSDANKPTIVNQGDGFAFVWT